MRCGKRLIEKRKIGRWRCRLWFGLAILMPVFLAPSLVLGQVAGSPDSLSLSQAIDLALKQNKNLRLARLAVTESVQKKEIARAAYFPHIKNESTLLHITELAGVSIPEGAFGIPSATGPIPGRKITIAQGGLTSYTSGTGLAQPFTQIFKIRESNRAAAADVRSATIRVDDVANAVSLKVRQVYYGILIAEQKRKSAQEAIEASKLRATESASEVEQGSSLEVSDLEAQASVLSAKQDLLTLDLQLTDLFVTLDDLLGLPLEARPHLQEDVSDVPITMLSRAEAIHIAREQSPDVLAAQQAVIKARAGLAAARDEYIPNVTGLARYSYQSGVPFLVHNFGTFGLSFSYDLFDGGRRLTEVREAQNKLSQAELNLSQVQDEVDVRVRSAYDKVDRLQALTGVAEELLKVRIEAARVSDRRYEENAALASDRAEAHAKNFSAQAALLEAQLGFSLAQGELLRILGRLVP